MSGRDRCIRPKIVIFLARARKGVSCNQENELLLVWLVGVGVLCVFVVVP